MKNKLTYTERVLNIWAITMILWSFYRAAFKTDLGVWFDELIAKPFIFLAPLYFFITRFENKDVLKSVGLKPKRLWYEVILGLIIGSAFFGLMMVTSNTPFFFDVKLPQWIVLAFATAIVEVVLSQGFVLERLYSESKNAITASVYASLLNFLLNVPIMFTTPGLTGDLLVKVLVMQLTLNLALSFLYIYRRSVYAPILVKGLYLLSVYLAV